LWEVPGFDVDVKGFELEAKGFGACDEKPDEDDPPLAGLNPALIELTWLDWKEGFEVKELGVLDPVGPDEKGFGRLDERFVLNGFIFINELFFLLC
jgi:hypothetical protein